MAKIMISYRPEDSGAITGRVFDRLVAHYGRASIFRDIDNIPPGANFHSHVDEVINQSDIVLALVGPRWMGSRGGQNRLSDEADPVRVEIEAALRKGVTLIPVLVLRANMPLSPAIPIPSNRSPFHPTVAHWPLAAPTRRSSCGTRRVASCCVL